MKFQILKLSLVMSLFIVSCQKDPYINTLSEGNFAADTAIALKNAAQFPMGVAINRGLYGVNATYTLVADRDFNSFTFENEMKHSSIVQSNGTYNYAQADALLNAVPAGTAIYGHVLAWHSQQRGDYLRTFTGLTVPAAAELLLNPGFEDQLNNWSVFNGGAAFSSTNVVSEVRTGTRALKVVNTNTNPNEQWRTQLASNQFTTIAGRQYTVSYWVRALNAGGSARISTSSAANNTQYQGDQTIGTTWQQITHTFTADGTTNRFFFDMGRVPNTYFIDDASVKEVITAPSGADVGRKVDEALNTYITNMVNRYKTRIKAWDVINEMFTENGDIRNEANTPQPLNNGVPDNGWFVWSSYLGRDFGVKAFNYARAADPTADLFINDFNLESSSRKLDSLIKYVAEIRAKGAKVDGIGTQMHIDWNTTYSGIDDMFRKLGATGLKIRITELDIRTVLTSAAKAPTPQLLAYQAQMANFVVESYLKHVPKPQRAGITIWGVHDNSSWRFNNGSEFPLFYDSSFKRKPAYTAILSALKNQ